MPDKPIFFWENENSLTLDRCLIIKPKIRKWKNENSLTLNAW
jgi:hypothetical protein